MDSFRNLNIFNQKNIRMRTLHALFVGINKYQTISGLDVAVFDAERVKKHFEQAAKGNFTPNFNSLHDEEATKANVVSAFEKQFINSNPKKGDVFLFYYSGHGGQEAASDAFEDSEADGKIENIACHDADLSNGKGFLADKEIRWLVHRAEREGVHFLMISDSCHSGDNTRGVTEDELPKAKKRMPGVSQQRAWSDFIFADKLAEADFKNKNLDDILPQGKHVSIGACQSMESAYEVSDGGVFTTGFLNYLKKSKGDISYFDLKTQIKSFVKSKFFDQSPQIYSVGDESQMFQTFLGGAVKDKPAYANVFYNFNERRWEMDMGGIYGVTKMWNGEKQQIMVRKNDSDMTAYVREVLPAGAVISFEPYSNVNKRETYQAYFPSLMTRRLNILPTGEAEGIDVLKKEITSKELEKAGIAWCDDSDDPDFAIRAVDGEYLITLPNDFKPLMQQEAGYQAAAAQNILKNLKAIGKWSFVKNLKNEDSYLQNDDISVEITEGGNVLEQNGNVVTLNDAPAKIKIKLTNEVGQQFHVGMVYLSSLFGMSPNLIQGQVQPLEGGKHILARAGRPISISLEDYIRDFKWKYETFYVQIIWATTEFGMELFLAEDLKAPRGNSKSAGTRGIDEDFSDEPDWQTKLIEFRVKNPDFS